jgi:hypothetical protein
MAPLGFTISNVIPPASASAPATGGMKCHLSAVSKCVPGKFKGCPGVVKKIPEQARTTTPRATRLTAMMFISNFQSVFFAGTAQQLAAKQYHYHDDDEKEADRAAAYVEGTGK